MSSSNDPPIPPRPANIMQRPSLLTGLNVADVLEHSNNGGPLTPWHVHDDSLRPVPPFYPPLDPHCTAVVVDATPSVVAVRLAECLKRRSVAVEYDEETITAQCMTVDRIHFCIHLYRGGPVEDTDFSHAVIVECLLTRGDTMSFHWTCRAILQAAMGHGSGQDLRKPIQTYCWEFPRLEPLSSEDKLVTARRASSTKTPALAMEHAMGLLKKDRLGAQQLGMESLVMLTDERSSGVETAVFCGLAILGSSDGGGSNKIHNWMVDLLRDGKLPTEMEDQSAIVDSLGGRSCVRSSLVDTREGSIAESTPHEDEHHGGVLRSLALRAFANSLTVLSREQPNLLSKTLFVHSPRLVGESFLSALVQDLQGATRSPIAVTGTRLASPHEAALAALCLRVLAEYSKDAKQNMLRCQPSVVEALEKAQAARHDVLAREAEHALRSLSGDVIAR